MTKPVISDNILLARQKAVYVKQLILECDSSLVGKAPPCQGGDRGFESRLSLKRRSLDFTGVPVSQGSFVALKITYALMKTDEKTVGVTTELGIGSSV